MSKNGKKETIEISSSESNESLRNKCTQLAIENGVLRDLVAKLICCANCKYHSSNSKKGCTKKCVGWSSWELKE